MSTAADCVAEVAVTVDRGKSALTRVLDWLVDLVPPHTIGDSKPRRDTPRPDPVRPVKAGIVS